VTVLLNENTVSTIGPVAPVIGAALDGSGVHESGMWPSPANRPDVGSRPTQPAPGTYTSAQACRSVKSSSGPGRAVERYDVGLELYEVARHEPCGETEPAQDRDEQPAGVAAGAERRGQCVAGRLDADLEPGRVRDVRVDRLVDRDEHVDDPHRAVAPQQRLDHRGDPGVDGVRARVVRVGRDAVQVRLEVALEVVRVGEGVVLRVLLDEEVERVHDRHVGDEVDDDLQLGGRLREHDARHVVAERVLLPVEEVVLGDDRERVGGDRRPGVRRGAQPDRVGADRHRARERVRGLVPQRHLDGHGSEPYLGDVSTR
jgi:hypothetical protein